MDNYTDICIKDSDWGYNYLQSIFLLPLLLIIIITMISHWSLNDSKSHVSMAFLSILADLNNAVVWMVSIRSLISKSSSPCSNPLVTVSIVTVYFIVYLIPKQGPSTYQSFYFLLVLLCGLRIDLLGRAFANGPGNRGSIPGQLIRKTQKYYLISP